MTETFAMKLDELIDKYLVDGLAAKKQTREELMIEVIDALDTKLAALESEDDAPENEAAE